MKRFRDGDYSGTSVAPAEQFFDESQIIYPTIEHPGRLEGRLEGHLEGRLKVASPEERSESIEASGGQFLN